MAVMAAVGVTVGVTAATEGVMEEAGSSAVETKHDVSLIAHMMKIKRNSPRSIPRRTTAAATARIRSAVDGLVAAVA